MKSEHFLMIAAAAGLGYLLLKSSKKTTPSTAVGAGYLGPSMDEIVKMENAAVVAEAQALANRLGISLSQAMGMVQRQGTDTTGLERQGQYVYDGF